MSADWRGRHTLDIVQLSSLSSCGGLAIRPLFFPWPLHGMAPLNLQNRRPTQYPPFLESRESSVHRHGV